jgi:Peptidase family M28
MIIRTLQALGMSALSATLLTTSLAQAAPWFGQGLPPPVNDPAKSVIPTPYDLPEQPATFGPGPKSPLLAGARIKTNVATIVGFSLESRAAGDYLWGRMSGAPAYYKTVSWAVDQLRSAGLVNAHLEDFQASLSTPLSGEARILGDPSFGEGTQDIVLQSAIVGGRGPVNGAVTAALIYVGHASSADLLGRDVKGKIAVIHSLPDPGLFGDREVGRPAALMAAGAVGVIDVLDQTGNMQSYDGDRHGCGTQLCFTVGGADGFFLENVLGRAGQAGKTVSARLSATSALRTGLKTANGVATLPGKTDRTIIINAHADAFFVGADDNAGGLATELALARYFATQPKLKHTLVFVVSAGHHTDGRGLPNFRVRHEADYVSRADLIINLEHVANIGVAREQTIRQDNNFGAQMVAATTEFPKAVAVSNRAPFLIDLWRQGAKCFGLAVQRVVDSEAPGELGAFTMIETMAGRNPEVAAANLKNVAIPVTQMISAGPLYHTSGETLDAAPAPGLERAARFHAYMIQAADAAAPRLLRGAAWTPRARCPATP